MLAQQAFLFGTYSRLAPVFLRWYMGFILCLHPMFSTARIKLISKRMACPGLRYPISLLLYLTNFVFMPIILIKMISMHLSRHAHSQLNSAVYVLQGFMSFREGADERWTLSQENCLYAQVHSATGQWCCATIPLGFYSNMRGVGQYEVIGRP